MAKPNDRESYERSIIEGADHFTAVRFLGVGRYERHQAKTRAEAEALARQLAKTNNGRYLIYAVKGTHDTYVCTVTASN